MNSCHKDTSKLLIFHNSRCLYREKEEIMPSLNLLLENEKDGRLCLPSALSQLNLSSHLSKIPLIALITSRKALAHPTSPQMPRNAKKIVVKNAISLSSSNTKLSFHRRRCVFRGKRKEPVFGAQFSSCESAANAMMSSAKAFSLNIISTGQNSR